MDINGYIQTTSNTMQMDLSNVAATANTDLVTTTNNPYKLGYLTPGFQQCSIFGCYVCFSAAVSLIVKRYVVSTATILADEVFPVEVANQPAFHSFQVSAFEQIQLRVSGDCNITKLTVWESKPI